MSERWRSTHHVTTGQTALAGGESPDAWLPFLLGAAVGGVAGAVVGTVLSEHTTHLIATMIAVVDRRLHEADRERLKFELLLQ
jgi:tetrahydromethanopterin S-methyltransferase subunit C